MIELAAAFVVFGVGLVLGRRGRPKGKRRIKLGHDARCAAGYHEPVKEEEGAEKLISVQGIGPMLVSECWCIRCGVKMRSAEALPEESELDRAESIREKLRAAEQGNGTRALKAST